MSTLDFHVIEVPNPFSEGRNRVYLFPTSPVTLVDTGVATEKAWDFFERGLHGHGLRVQDIEQIVVTHKHIDHLGNAGRIQRESDAKIFIHESEAGAVENVDPGGARYRQLARERLDGWNVPCDEQPDNQNLSGPVWQIEAGSPTSICDGDRIAAGSGELEVIHTPGHTAGSICLKYGELLFSGDHVLPKTSPNIGGGDMRQRGLLRRYLKSLDRVRQLHHVQTVCPGHGDSFPDLAKRCDVLARHHRRRLNAVLELLGEHGSQTVYALARRMFGELAGFHVVLGCAEAASHLEYLVEEGQVVADGAEYRRAQS